MKYKRRWGCRDQRQPRNLPFVT